jgi:hypothetical protein
MDNEADISLPRGQALRIMAISVMMKDGDLELVGDDARMAMEAMSDAGEEIALQVGGVP